MSRRRFWNGSRQTAVQFPAWAGALAVCGCLAGGVAVAAGTGSEGTKGNAAASAPTAPKESAAIPEKVRPYVGLSPRIDDPLMRAAYIADTSMSLKFYPPGTADWDQKNTQVVLNEQTADFLYSQFTPLTLKYVAGSRPVLERIIRKLCKPGMTERDKVLAIMRYCWDGFRKEWAPANAKQHLMDVKLSPDGVHVLNASEEEILKLGGGQCEDRSRLIICLCQVAGIPARFVASYSYFLPDKGYTTRGGHAIVELYVDGGWAFFDSLQSYYWVKPDGRLASLWDLIRDPDLSAKQPESVLKDCGKTREQFVRYHQTNLTKRQVITLTHYYVWDGGNYDWEWVIYDESDHSAFVAGLEKEGAELRKKALRDIGISPEQIK